MPDLHTPIPLYGHDGRICAAMPTLDASALDTLGPRVSIVRNRRGHPVRAYLSGQPPMRPIAAGNAGRAYQEPVCTGSVWALRMAPGVAL